jgi:hypothetical protein
MISPPAMDDLLSYLLLGGGALIIFGLLSLFKDQVEKRQRELTRKIRKKKTKPLKKKDIEHY